MHVLAEIAHRGSQYGFEDAEHQFELWIDRLDRFQRTCLSRMGLLSEATAQLAVKITMQRVSRFFTKASYSLKIGSEIQVTPETSPPTTLH